MKRFQPKSLVLQWHVTERCNWRCKHCYQEGSPLPEMELPKLKETLAGLAALAKEWYLRKRDMRIHITGGEPFIRKDFMDFLREFKNYSKMLNWSILSNGSMLTDEIVRELKDLGIEGFQVSLEGTQKINDEIRNAGSFEKIIQAIKLLTKNNISTRVSFTLSRKNQNEIRALARILAPLGVGILGIRRITPLGSGHDPDLVLEPQELRKVYLQIQEINKEMIEKDFPLRLVGGCESAIFNDEIAGPNLMNSSYCGLIDGRILTLMPNGDVLACRRLPIKIGNVNEKSLKEIYYSPVYTALRETKKMPLECYACENFKNCKGGAKCITYGLTGKTAPDVQCWKLFENLKEAQNYIVKPTLRKKGRLIFRNLKKMLR